MTRRYGLTLRTVERLKLRPDRHESRRREPLVPAWCWLVLGTVAVALTGWAVN